MARRWRRNLKAGRKRRLVPARLSATVREDADMSDEAPATISERAALHIRLDELLDQRELIEAHQVRCYARDVVPMAPLGRAAKYDPRAAYVKCLSFARDVSGPMLPWLALQSFPEHLPNAARLLALRDRLSLARALLEPSGEPPVVSGTDGTEWVLGRHSRLDLAAINGDLLALAHGDTSELFAPVASPEGGRAAGQKSKRHQLACARLRALELDHWHLGENERRPTDRRVPPATWRPAIVAAFGASGWDVISKWKQACRRDLGAMHVELLLIAARAGLPEGWRPGADASADDYTKLFGSALQALARATKGETARTRQPRVSRRGKS